MKAFPAEADEAALIILMSVVRADHKILEQEMELVLSFFADQLSLSAERLAGIQKAMVRFTVEELPEAHLRDTLESLPESARDLLFSAALRIAMADDELVESERRELVRIGRTMGLSEREVQARLLEAAGQREDAFFLLGVPPDADQIQIQTAYQSAKEKYSPAGLARLGVAFQSLALDRLERIEWAYRTLSENFHGDSVERRSEPREWGRSNRTAAFEPKTLDSDSSPKLWKQLPRILSEIWRGSERDWDIVQRRLGLIQTPCQSRDEITEDYQLTRQAVRQIEIQGKRVLRALLLSGRFHQQHLHPLLLELCQTVFEAIQTARTDPVMKLADYVAKLHAELGWEAFSPDGLFRLFEEWLELSRATILGEDFVFHSHSPEEVEAFKSACEQLQKFLSTQGGSARVELIRETFYRRFIKLRCSAELFLDLMPGTAHSDREMVLAAGDETVPRCESLTPEQIKLGKFIEQYFSQSFHNSVPFRVLGLHIQEVARVPYRVATSILRYHPAVVRERVGGRLYAGLRRDWREASSPKFRSEPTTQEIVDESLRERLQGEDEVALQAILPDLQAETGLQIPELQSYAERSEVCRVVDRDGKKWVSAF
ncbi:MAG: TerB family tellurite resistance protein [Vulcanimicrobiota bacterium]